MLSFLLLAQLALPAEPGYASPALEALVARAAAANHAPPPAFKAYRARVESELALILGDSLLRENAVQIEQFASSVAWARSGRYDMRILGYRSQGVGVPYSTLSFVRGWTEPSLYGERLALGAQPVRDTTPKRPPAAASDTIVAVHPFAADRNRYYTFSGGDTVAVLHSGPRTFSIIRIRVTPRALDSTAFAALDGEIQIDAERGEIVRMRGRFVVRSRERPLLARLPGVVGVAYVDFTNAEVNGRYWLPATQRTEFQSSVAFLGRSRAMMRVVSEFSDYEVDEGATATPDVERIAHITTWAPRDSVNHYGDWQTSLGTLTASGTARDFDDLAPDIWRPTGAPRFDLFPARTQNLLGFDRVQGLYTGAEGSVYLRDAFPGLSAGARIGYAWSEHTVRGGVHANLERGASSYGLRAERVLESTNDFLRPFDAESGQLFSYLGSLDDFDYVDRRRAVATVSHAVAGSNGALIVAQLGVGDDHAEVTRVAHGLFSSPAFRINRNVAPGSYALGVVDIELHPNVSGDFVSPGFGARLHQEVAHGGISWQRTELSLSAREYIGPVTLALHGDGGLVTGSAIPPQQLFELGGTGTLPGYAYKEFAGDRAALIRSYASYTLPLWREPVRVWRNILVPGVSPGFAVGFGGGWTDISSAAAAASVASLGAPARASGGLRATAGGGLTFFGGNLHVGVARALDAGERWKLAVGFGQEF